MSLSFKNNYIFITYVFEYFFLYLTYYMPVLHSYKKSESIWCSMKKRTFLRISYGPRPTSLLKKRLWHRCFPMIFAKFLRTTFLQNASGRLRLLKLYYFTYLFPLRKKCRKKEFFWSVFSCIQSEYRKMRTTKISVFERFSHSELLLGRASLRKKYLSTYVFTCCTYKQFKRK